MVISEYKAHLLFVKRPFLMSHISSHFHWAWRQSDLSNRLCLELFQVCCYGGGGGKVTYSFTIKMQNCIKWL